MFTIVALLLTVSLFAKEETLKSVPTKYQGNYYMIGYSNDEGETIEDINDVFFCKINGTNIVNYDNDLYKVIKVIRISVKEDNSEVILVYVNNGHTWIMSFSDALNKKLVVIKDYDSNTGEERSRSLFIKR